MEITPVVTPELYVSMLVLYLATICFRMLVGSVSRARRARVTLRPVRTAEASRLPMELSD